MRLGTELIKNELFQIDLQICNSQRAVFVKKTFSIVSASCLIIDKF